MEDKATLAKARRELEGFYSSPDDSLDLSFKDFASFQEPEPKPIRIIAPIREDPNEGAVEKSPSIDFRKGLRGAAWPVDEPGKDQHRPGNNNVKTGLSGIKVVVDTSQVKYNDASFFSTTGGACRRPGIPHSNICTVCTVYIYIWKNRCLVCGRVYCRQCVDEGMGEMSEGRKCIECLGRRFSQRYIHKAGQTGCCGLRYSGLIKQQELKWAEMGPRKNEDKQYGKSYMSRQYMRSVVDSRSMRPTSVGQFGNSKIAGSPRSHVGDGSGSNFASPEKFIDAHAFPL